MTDKPVGHYRCSSCQQTPKTNSLHPPASAGQGEKSTRGHQLGWGGLILLCDHDSAFRRDYKHVLIILHCQPLFATRQQMLLNSHVQTTESKDMRHCSKEVGSSSGNAVPESRVQLILQCLSPDQMPQKVWRFYFSLGCSPRE